MKTIAFIGLGLIGGSIARAMRQYHPDYHIYAYVRTKETLLEAMEANIIDSPLEEDDPRIAQCDYIFLCAPVESNIRYLPYLKERISPSCIITDVGSVKGIIHDKIHELGMDTQFIGGHPMAGTEKSGFSNSTARLIENAYYMLTPGENLSMNTLAEFTELISSIGSIPLTLSSEEHDYITAGVSHLPHIIASSLVNLVSNLDDMGYMRLIAAGGFRDITRIASSSPEVWEQICMENQTNISKMLDEYIRMLIQVRCTLDNGEFKNIYNMFADSKEYRDSIDVKSGGLMGKAYVLYIDLADEAGGIATIATILAMDKINIKNIGIIHNREFVQGVLNIQFYDEDSKIRAKQLLTKRNYSIYDRDDI